MTHARVAVLVALFLSMFGATASAADVRQGTVIVPADATVEDDLYATGDTITIAGTVKGDVVAVGFTVRVDGTVTGNLIAVANSITVHGQLGGSVRGVGMTIAIDGKVAGDAFVAGNDVTIATTGRVARDVYVEATTFTNSGEIGRDLRSGTYTTTIDGRVGRNVESDGDTVRVTAKGVVEGALKYTSGKEAAIEKGATVKGPVSRNNPQPAATAAGGSPVFILNWLRGGVGLLILGLILVYLFPAFSRRAGEAIVRAPLRSLLVGLLVLIFVPIVAVLLFSLVSIVGGWWLGFAVLGFYVAALAVSIPISALGLGASLLRVTRRPAVPAIALVVGLVLLLLAGLVPIVGVLVILLAAVFGLGAAGTAIAGGRRPDSSQAQPLVVT